MSRTEAPDKNLDETATGPVEDFASVGQALLQRREELSYTLEHVAEITRITLSNLRALEAGDIPVLPSLVFVRGFVRNYASLLGLSSDWMIIALNQEYGNLEEPVAEDMLLANLGASKQAPVLALLLGGVLALGIGVFWLLQPTSGPVEPPVVIQAVSQVKVDAKSVEEQKKILQSQISPLTLILKAKENQWVTVAVDEKRPKTLLLEKGTKMEFPGQESYHLVMTTGRTAEVYLNGEQIEVPAEANDQLYTVKLTKFSLTRQNN